jgi:Mg-chelatase subunit ChlI
MSTRWCDAGVTAGEMHLISPALPPKQVTTAIATWCCDGEETMLKKALTVGAAVIVAILASGGVAQASVDEAHAAQVLSLAAPASPDEPEPAPAPESDDDAEPTPEPDSDSESTESDSDSTESESDSDSTSDSESDSNSESDSTESDPTTEPETPEEEELEPAPAPEPAAGPLGLIESLLTSVTSLFG